MGKRSKRKEAERRKALKAQKTLGIGGTDVSRQDRKENRLNGLKSIPGRIVALICFVSAVIGLLVLWPRPVAVIGVPVYPKDPFSAIATVTNNGALPLRAVSFLFAVRSIKTSYGTSGLGSDDPSRFAALKPMWFEPQDLTMDKGFDFPLNKMVDAGREDLGGADIAIAVVYQLPVIPHRFVKVFAYKADRQTDGNFYWYKYAAPEQSFDRSYAISGPLRIPPRAPPSP